MVVAFGVGLEAGVGMEPVTAVLVGAGDRGANSYAPYALANPHRLRFVGVAEPDDSRRDQFAALHRIDAAAAVRDWRELLSGPVRADAVLVCTQDRMHFEPAVAALAQGYDVLLEKPMSTDPSECVRLGEIARVARGRILVCYVLRYTSFFAAVRRLLDEGRVGGLVSIQHTENVPLVDQTHAFVRGSWGRETDSCPMILAHCCHDMDLLSWFAGAPCRRVASFGGLAHFRRENAPPGAPARCLDGCPHETTCPHHVARVYLTEDTGWPTSVISTDPSAAARVRALETGPYGRCVYACDNDVVDHQVASFEFENEVTAAFTMSPFNGRPGRTLKLMGSAGEIRASMAENEIEVLDFATGRADVVRPARSHHRYGGGDHGIMERFVDLVRDAGSTKDLTFAADSVESHLMAFAAEKSRVEGRTVVMADYRREIADSTSAAGGVPRLPGLPDVGKGRPG